MEMNSAIDIRDATLADAREILLLQKAAYRQEADLYNDDTIPPLTQTLAEIEAEFHRQTFLAASLSGRIVGSVRAFVRDGTVHIGRLIVAPECQRRGLGTRLMGAVEERFKDIPRFELFTGEKSTGNLAFYHGLGYKIFRRERLSEKVVLVFLEKVS